MFCKNPTSDDLDSSFLIQIVFEGESGYSFQGDIAIDDITFATSSVQCAILPTDAQPFGCNFEFSNCNWRPSFTFSSYRWQRQSGIQAIKSSTGTKVDHTIGKGN